MAEGAGIRRFRLSLGVVFVLAGVLHFVYPRAYERIVPPYLPAPLALVLVSGAAESAGGLGICFAGTRRVAGWGLMLLLAAVFPANVHMALHPEDIPGLDIPHWLLWARLPMQPLLVAVVWWTALRRTPTKHP